LAHDTTELASVTVDGQAVAFDSANRAVLHRAYTAGAPEIAVETKDNAVAYVVPPLHYPYGSYVIRVVSENGEQHAAYALDLDVPPAPVAEVTVVPPAVTVGEDETVRLTVNATDETGAAIDLGGGSAAGVPFSSSHESVAGGDGSGVVTGRLSGTASVSATVTYGGGAKT
ncbi:hypothetical protein, partial [Bifidobacterium callitrichidarum]